MSIRSIALTAGIFGAASMFLIAWWLILIGNAEGPPTLLERMYIGYSFTPLGSIIVVLGFLAGILQANKSTAVSWRGRKYSVKEFSQNYINLLWHIS